MAIAELSSVAFLIFLGLATSSTAEHAFLQDKLPILRRLPSTLCHLRCAKDSNKVRCSNTKRLRWCEFAWRDRVYNIIHFQVRARLHLISWLGLRKLSCCITCITSLKPVRKRLHLAAFSIQDWKNLVFKSNAGKIFTKIIPTLQACVGY